MIGKVPVISTRAELQQLKDRLKVRDDWRWPDGQAVSAEARGKSFGNDGFYGWESELERLTRYGPYAGAEATEMYVRLSQDGKPVADVPLATLFAWATGYEQG